MAHTITLQRLAISQAAFPTTGQQHTWPMRITATAPSGSELDPAIFVYKAMRSDDPWHGDIFECVASAHQMQELGTQPRSLENGDYMPFYRRDVLDFHCRSAQEHDDLFSKVCEDVADLCANMDALSLLSVEQTITIP